MKACLPALTETGGALGLVGSTNGYVSVPTASAYCASKHALRSLAVCLRHELACHGVSVTHLAPGFITTELRRVDNAGEHHPQAADPVPAWLQMPGVSRGCFPGFPGASRGGFPSEVATKIT